MCFSFFFLPLLLFLSSPIKSAVSLLVPFLLVPAGVSDVFLLLEDIVWINDYKWDVPLWGGLVDINFLSMIHIIWISFSIWPVFAYAEFKQGWWVGFFFISTIDAVQTKCEIVRWFRSLLDFKIFIPYFFQDSIAALFSIWDLFDIFDTPYPPPTPKKVKLQDDVGAEELIQYYRSIFILRSFPPFLTCDLFPFLFSSLLKTSFSLPSEDILWIVVFHDMTKWLQDWLLNQTIPQMRCPRPPYSILLVFILNTKRNRVRTIFIYKHHQCWSLHVLSSPNFLCSNWKFF